MHIPSTIRRGIRQRNTVTSSLIAMYLPLSFAQFRHRDSRPRHRRNPQEGTSGSYIYMDHYQTTDRHERRKFDAVAWIPTVLGTWVMLGAGGPHLTSGPSYIFGTSGTKC
ncbi:hypothetical protein B0H12DRAFT_786132 [Mycena haematopus]|nr:hypothetical protein B0H12DRAFT_786132 [Mycena haematopus]